MSPAAPSSTTDGPLRVPRADGARLPASASASDLVRVRLDLAYDGTDFAGWAVQPDRRTVQGVLEDGLAVVLRSPGRVRLTVAGRTDAGVHARGQVAHLDVPREVWAGLGGRAAAEPGTSLVRRLTGVLPPDVVVRSAIAAPEGFDARFAALSRRYVYRICDDPALRDPLRRDVLWHRGPLDVAAMDRAASRLTGEHDYAAYCRPRAGATTIRDLHVLAWSRPAGGADAGLAVAEVVADAFCHSMVRALVGACVAVGLGRRAEDWPAHVLDGGRRDPGAVVVPAGGLTLEGVRYPGPDGLLARTLRTRAVRSAPEDGQWRARTGRL